MGPLLHEFPAPQGAGVVARPGRVAGALAGEAKYHPDTPMISIWLETL